ncbi:MAG TPA: pyridoxamine 5'-phosphate oxidase [Dysgonomonas sp.]|nr:pyridoxamine 5'-phosphate oxidase [Dysgonomonas sp.]
MMNISDLRKEYSLKTLDERDVLPDPLGQFELWLGEAVNADVMEANAMCLSTVGKDLRPSSRFVLLKQVRYDGFVFFTNYESRKADQIDENPYCALTFFWSELERQVRIEGTVEKLSAEDSDAYFEMRPEKSKLGAWASPQSRIISGRRYLEIMVEDFESTFANSEIPRPDVWGGYVVKPVLIEFWQGRPSRLHDRIQYKLGESQWQINRLAP